MTKILLLVFVNYCLLKISQAQLVDRTLPPAPPTANAKPPISPTIPPMFEGGPKCYPETATAYFLPAPPSSPKVTVLDPNYIDVAGLNSKLPEIIPNVKESKPLSSVQMTSPSFPPPPPSFPGLPNLIDEAPTIVQGRFSRLAGTNDKSGVCETCAKLLKKLPIFNFDQELLDGFLAGIKL